MVLTIPHTQSLKTYFEPIGAQVAMGDRTEFDQFLHDRAVI